MTTSAWKSPAIPGSASTDMSSKFNNRSCSFAAAPLDAVSSRPEFARSDDHQSLAYINLILA